MKYDEFAFFNQQLAAMLRDGIPLEGALRRLCTEMRAGSLRAELQALETDLGQGKPMAEALKSRQLPELYKRMVLVGVKGGDLPGALTMLADYYQRQSNVLARLRSLMVYPLIVLLVSFLISSLLAVIWMEVIGPSFMNIFSGMGISLPGATLFALATLKNIWTFPVILGVLFFFVLGIVFTQPLRGRFLWRLPAFKEASISRVAGALHLLLKHGIPLPEAINLVGQLETNHGAVADLKLWQKNVTAGVTKFSDVAAGNQTFPPMFVWIVATAGEDLAGGLNRAAEIYQSRATYRTETAVYSVLPVASLLLGAIVLSQALLVLCMFLPFIAMISNLGG